MVEDYRLPTAVNDDVSGRPLFCVLGGWGADARAFRIELPTTVDCMYVRSGLAAEYGSTGCGCQPCSWSAQQGKYIFSVPVHAWEYGLVRQVEPFRPASARSFSTLRLNHQSGASSRLPQRRPHMPSPTIGSVPSLLGHVSAYRWRLPPRFCRHRAIGPQSSSSNGCCSLRNHFLFTSLYVQEVHISIICQWWVWENRGAH